MNIACFDPKGRPISLDIEGRKVSAVQEDSEHKAAARLWAYPAFCDAHMHPVYISESRDRLAALPPEVNSLAELIAALKSRKPKAGWLIAWGYDEDKWPEKRHPHRLDLDKVSRELPVIAIRNCTHMIAANSKALELCGITEDTPNPPGGVIERDEQGLTGLVKEEARYLIMNAMPVAAFEEQAESLARSYQDFYHCGIAAVSEMLGSEKEWALYEAVRQEPMSVAVYWDCAKAMKTFPEELSRQAAQGPYLRGLKVLSDGSVGGRTALRSKPYKDIPSCGVRVADQAFLKKALELAHKEGVELSVHAMGDLALSDLLNLYETSPVKPSLRIEHATMMTLPMIRKAKALGIRISSQPVFYFSEIEAYEQAYEEAELAKLYPHRLYEDEGAVYSLSSDAPATAWAEAYNPWVGIYAAVTRRAYTGRLVGPEMALRFDEAFRAYTDTAWKMLGLEAPALIKGAPAAFQFYEADLRTIPAEKYLELSPKAVLIGEKWVKM